MKNPAYIRSLLALVLGLSATQVIAAQPTSDFYLSLGTGYQQRADASDSAGTATFESGALFSGALGYRMNALRLEAEGIYLANDIESEDPSPTPLGNLPKEDAEGDVSARAYMVNLNYDFAPTGALKPYAGIGIGAIKGKINGLTTPGLSSVPPPYGPIVVNAESDWTFAHQLKVGASYALNPRAEIFFGYRYIKSNNLDIYLTFSGETIHPKAAFHAGEVGLRINF
jgi:opacity protein-like surface antigen